MKTNNGLTATKSVDLAVSPMMVPTEPQLDRYVNATSGTNVYAGTTTPTLKWKPYPGDNYYYRVKVQDWKTGGRLVRIRIGYSAAARMVTAICPSPSPPATSRPIRRTNGKCK